MDENGDSGYKVIEFAAEGGTAELEVESAGQISLNASFGGEGVTLVMSTAEACQLIAALADKVAAAGVRA